MNLEELLKQAEESEAGSKYSLRSVDSIEEEVRSSLLKMIERGGKASSVLRKQLLEKEYQAEIIDQLISRFIEVGLIDDYALAKEWAQTLSTRKAKSKSMVAMELREKGFSQDAIDEAVAELNQDRELEVASALALAKMERMKGLDSSVRERRVAGFLSRKGYSSNVVWAAVRAATQTLAN